MTTPANAQNCFGTFSYNALFWTTPTASLPNGAMSTLSFINNVEVSPTMFQMMPTDTGTFSIPSSCLCAFHAISSDFNAPQPKRFFCYGNTIFLVPFDEQAGYPADSAQWSPVVSVSIDPSEIIIGCSNFMTYSSSFDSLSPNYNLGYVYVVTGKLNGQNANSDPCAFVQPYEDETCLLTELMNVWLVTIDYVDTDISTTTVNLAYSFVNSVYSETNAALANKNSATYTAPVIVSLFPSRSQGFPTLAINIPKSSSSRIQGSPSSFTIVTLPNDGSTPSTEEFISTWYAPVANLDGIPSTPSASSVLQGSNQAGKPIQYIPISSSATVRFAPTVNNVFFQWIAQDSTTTNSSYLTSLNGAGLLYYFQYTYGAADTSSISLTDPTPYLPGSRAYYLNLPFSMKYDSNSSTYSGSWPYFVFQLEDAFLSPACMNFCRALTDSGGASSTGQSDLQECNTYISSACFDLQRADSYRLIQDPRCQTLCFETHYATDCTGGLVNICASSQTDENGVPYASYPFCQCYLSKQFYANFYATEYYPGLDSIENLNVRDELAQNLVQNLITLPYCTYPPCANSFYKPRNILNQDNSVTCPDDVVCLATVNIDVSGGATFNANNVDIDQQTTCQTYIQDVGLINTVNSSQNPPPPPVDESNNYWIFFAISGILIVTSVALLVLSLKKSTPKSNKTAKPATQSAAKPAAKPGTQSVSKPVAKPGTQAVAKPAAKPVAKPAAKPAAQSVSKPSAKPSAKVVGKSGTTTTPQAAATPSVLSPSSSQSRNTVQSSPFQKQSQSFVAPNAPRQFYAPQLSELLERSNYP